MTLEEFLKHVYHTRKYVIIPALNRARIDKNDFLNKKGHLDSKKLRRHLCKIYDKFINKQEKNMKE
jgi:sulfur relay (sulfurtransferase) DsrF/TusC family protein